MHSFGKGTSSQGYLHIPDQKRKYNKELFAVVAPRYQFVTRALSFGRDQSWKKTLVRELPEITEGLIVDIACGTGDITMALACRYTNATILGMDLTPGMLAVADSRKKAENVRYVCGDMHDLALDACSVSCVTGGYALRNAPELGAALKEIHRVLKPGGYAAFLDFSKPPLRLAQVLEHRVLHMWGSFWGMVLHKNPSVYAYIAESLRTYPDRVTLRKKLNAHSLKVLSSRPLFWGFAELTLCRKAP
ncbi:MAG: class I SAM-dependent methyltransferase [Fibrobacterota bacterium]